jgi:uncharacterized membrane protein YuzA (DUF378 family)
MNVFVIAAAIIAMSLLAAALRGPRPSMFVAAILWLAYAAYERQIATGVLCDANCNIRVDLVLILPILLIATAYAVWSFRQPPGHRTITGMVLGAIGLAIVSLVTAALGYTALAAILGLAALAIIVYAMKSKSTPNHPHGHQP